MDFFPAVESRFADALFATDPNDSYIAISLAQSKSDFLFRIAFFLLYSSRLRSIYGLKTRISNGPGIGEKTEKTRVEQLPK